MLKNFYPALRNAGYLQVYYDIDRTASVALRRCGRSTAAPRGLARTVLKTSGLRGSTGLCGTWSKTANALKELEGQQENPAAFNYIRRMLHDERITTAEKFLRKAEAAGDPYASVNLEHRASQRSNFRVLPKGGFRHCLKTGDTRCICGGYLYWSSVGINFRNDRSDNRTLKKLQIIFIPINHVNFVCLCLTL